jgi:hypothetical protein
MLRLNGDESDTFAFSTVNITPPSPTTTNINTDTTIVIVIRHIATGTIMVNAADN